MNRVISLLQNIRLRQIVTIFLVGLTFLVSTAFDIHGNQLQAQAEPVTPEATNYKTDTGDNQTSVKVERIQENAEKSAKLLADEGKQVKNRAVESSQASGKNLFDNIREKLNLDEPIDPGTKKAVNQLEDTASKAVKAPQRALKDAVD
jgi:hypothetical protein